MDYNIQPFNTHRTTTLIHIELEKERTRSHILTEEIQRRRILESQLRRELILQHEMTSSLVLRQPLNTNYNNCYRVEPGLVWHDEPVFYESRRRSFVMPLTEGYDGVNGFNDVPLRRRDLSPEIETLTVKKLKSNDDKKEMIGLGHTSGPKRKAPRPQTQAKKEDFNCRVCNICATSAQSLKDHLSGKKHLAKVGAKSKKIKKKPNKKRKKQQKQK